MNPANDQITKGLVFYDRNWRANSSNFLATFELLITSTHFLKVLTQPPSSCQHLNTVMSAYFGGIFKDENLANFFS